MTTAKRITGLIEGSVTQRIRCHGLAPSRLADSYSVRGTSTSAGYPEDSTLFYPVLLYLQAFSYFNMGYASAMTMLLLVVALTVTLLILRSSRLWVFYAGARR